mgnify:CR=1 FL=1
MVVNSQNFLGGGGSAAGDFPPELPLQESTPPGRPPKNLGGGGSFLGGDLVGGYLDWPPPPRNYPRGGQTRFGPP